MDIHTDVLGGRNENRLAENVTASHATESGIIVLIKDSDPGNPQISDVHVCVATETGGIETDKEQYSFHMCSLEQQECSDNQSAEKKMNHEHPDCVGSQNGSNQVDAPAIPEVPLSELPVALADESTPVIDPITLELPSFIHSQGLPSSCSRSVSETIPRDDRESGASADDALNCIQILDTELDDTDIARLTSDGETREDFACSQLPNSSPPQLFSSSPCVSSQSSSGSIEPPKMVDASETVTSPSTRDRPDVDHVELDKNDSEFRYHRDVVHAVTTKTAENISERPALYIEGSPRPTKKRTAYQNDDGQSHGSQTVKRSKSGSNLYPPPAPMRATLASQSHQFKKLAAPFRPPSKLPVARDEAAQTTKNATKSAGIIHPKPCQKEPAQVLRPQYKVSNTSRSVTQFKSPLINRVPSTDTRTIRLTPAIQALERKLQALKRAVKVKEDKEEEVLTRLAQKWIEAGREVAYDVWDATKDAGNFEEKGALACKSYDNRNTSWGWDIKREEAAKESYDPDLPMADCETDPLDAEEDEDSFHNTLGTMLRQLGIAPEILGWDDDKEVFL